MTDNLEVFSEIRQIRDRLESIEQTQELLVRADLHRILALIWQEMDNEPILAHVYLAVDGVRTQSVIADNLRAKGIPGSEPTVSRRLDKLRELGLVELIDQTKAGKVYRRTRVDRILGVARRLERRLLEATKSGNGTASSK